jgi:hypothetical protein
MLVQSRGYFMYLYNGREPLNVKRISHGYYFFWTLPMAIIDDYD